MRKLFLSTIFLVVYTLSISQALDLSIQGYDMHVELNWSPVNGADRYEVWRKNYDDSVYYLIADTRQLRLQDWTERTGTSNDTFTYFVQALNVPGAILNTSDTITAFVFPMADDQFLDMVQAYTFRYFWEHAHPVSGLARERLNSGDIVTTGGSGFGVMSIIVGIHRGYITREEGVNRLLQMVSFLQFADRFHGVFPHWMNGQTGEALSFSTFDNGGDLVETAFLMQGLLTARQYFDSDNESENVLREVITSLWEDVEWDYYSRNNSGVLYWHWSPDFGWQMNFPIRGYNEALIVYLLAIASPTHAVPASYWHTGWAGGNYVNGLTWYGYKLFVGPPLGGPLFFAHYSYMGFDPRNKKDAYANYFEHNTNHTLVNRAWCIDNPLNFEGYNENSWGLTASDDPWGYAAHAPGGMTDNGTLTPAAAIPSMPYTPEESINVLKHFYRAYGQELWGHYGFYDAFNPEVNWFSDSYLAIDQGPIINMIENYRSALLWNAFMSNPEINPALEMIGFTEDIVSSHDINKENIEWNIFPTITNDNIQVSLSEINLGDYWSIMLIDQSGRVIIDDLKMTTNSHLKIPTEHLNHYGLMWVALKKNGLVVDSKPVWLKK